MAKRAILALSILLALSSCASEEKAEPIKVKTVTGVKTERVGVMTFYRNATFSGTVIPSKEILLSPKVPGYLIEVKAKAGERVKKGQVLAVIDSSTIKPDVEKAKAGLKEIDAAFKELHKALLEVKARKKAAQAQYELALKTYNRFKKLLEADAVSKQKFDEVKAQYEAAKANLQAVNAKEAQIKAKLEELKAKKKQVEASLQKAEAYLSYTYLKSPVNGVVLQKLVDKGNLVSPQTPVFKLGTYPLEVRAYVDNAYFGKIKVGTPVTVKVAGETYRGKVVEVDHSADPVSHKFGIKVTAEGLKAVPGTYAVVEFPTVKVETIVVPKSAIYRVGALEFVFVVKDGVAHLRPVKTGETIGDKVVILSGLRPGEVIAVTKVNSLVDGARVEG
ncbi:efflux transporter, RND family, MFP subunit [Thermovibrio ammonificans HB-1]|uniref:Efflux transporter, RND family, MFP subunit n=1 Tax=Thermovibrio ammonificans (strain DSM 15698 / JCM 12110 / HB-1) TaxID=648996 RepID=E8T6D7_THEA1|nr:efflux RND transporter periplasmic adaptor subunit [Thermovibrio ammonificans]ADU96721.1 efflux transporter, RND family, MFP subunit [Thermovibrio ammonificans HB-1]